MIILAIETSCDETSVAIIENGNKIHANLVASQVKLHAKYGGVVPEFASRMHAEKIHFLIDEALQKANLSFDNLDAVAVTYGPGLEGALLVGLVAAKTIAYLKNIPLIGINHLHGHIYANFLLPKPPEFPFITLLVSGGHTQLILVKSHFQFELLGTTRDDAAGEVFDKIARFLELGYPGGPIVEKNALLGNSKAFKFPKPMLKQELEFSFSGLKTAVIQELIALKNKNVAYKVEDVCASFQDTVISLLLIKALRACEKYQVTRLALGGGVTANKTLRTAFEKAASDRKIELFIPPFTYCTDNAAMIGAAAYYAYQMNPVSDLALQVKPNLTI